MAMIPLLAMAIPALLSGIHSAVDIARSSRAYAQGKGIRHRYAMRRKGGRMRHLKRKGGRVHHRKNYAKHARRGKGVFADIVSGIPLLGSVAGPLIRSLGGRISRGRVFKRGHGLAPMHMRSLTALARGPKGYGGRLMPYGAITPAAMIHKMLPMMKYGRGLLMPAGGAVRRGHYRVVNGRRVRVAPTIVRGKGLRRHRRGGYIPYTF